MLRCMDRRERVPALVKALGFEARLDRLPENAVPARSGREDGVCAAFVAGERGTMRVVLVELSDEASTAGVSRFAQAVRQRDLARQHLFLAAGPGYRRVLLGCFGLEGELRHLTIERSRVLRTDIEALEEMVAVDGEGGLALAVRHARALDRSRVTRQFFEDFAGHRARVAAAWLGVAPDAIAERERLALLFLCRCMFLYFLQRRGHLGNDPSYVVNLWNRWRRGGAGRGREESAGITFFRAVIEPLFFGALNRRPAARDVAARALGAVPYLNGGLFERHVLERHCPELDLPDDVVGGVIDRLFERYRFTTRDAADELLDGASDAGVDPEMLGRVFEGMMAAGRRGDTGTYYTPAMVVDRLIGEAMASYLEASAGVSGDAARDAAHGRTDRLAPAQRSAIAHVTRDMRVLDPACGSGAFLLGALSRLARLRTQLEAGDAAELRRDIVGRALHGVDVQGDAALLCALRLWLAITIDAERHTGVVPPLPNLDRRIRQGDALLDPLDLGDGTGSAPGPEQGALLDVRVRGALRALAPAGERYLTAEPSERDVLKRELATRERALAAAWLAAVDARLGRELAELRSLAAARDLFGEAVSGAAAAKGAIPRLDARRAELAELAAGLRDSGTLPFFSFRVHFAEAAAGFDLIVSNPPWVRAHRWPASIGRLVRRRYAVCRDPGWRHGATLAGAPVAAGAQVDLSQLFIERSLALLKSGGVLAMIVPAKTFRSLYGGPARRMLTRSTRLTSIEDHSLDPRAVFQADAFAGVVIARKSESAASEAAAPAVRIALFRRGVEPLRFDVAPHELPLFEADAAAPWLLAPEPVRRVMRRMQTAGAPLGASGLRVRRGIFTGANDVLIVREAKPRLGGLCQIRAEGAFRAARARRPARSQHAGVSRRGPRGRTAVAAGAAGSAYDALVETAALRPLLRGCDVGAWSYAIRSHVVWVHGPDGEPTLPPPRLARYLARHDAALRARAGVREGQPPGAVFRVSADALAHKVTWQDLADTLGAVAVPATVRSPIGETRPVVPLNTVYFIPVGEEIDALLLAAYLNALPLSVFARAIAERAKDARFRFFAWTVAALPLPAAWRCCEQAPRLVELSRRAHADGGITEAASAELDALVARAYGLDADDVAALGEFDRWLRGRQ